MKKIFYALLALIISHLSFNISEAFAQTWQWDITQVSSSKINAVEDITVQLSDILGRNIANYTGSTSDVNRQLDAQAAQLSTGTYLLKVNTASGKSEVFKITKQ